MPFAIAHWRRQAGWIAAAALASSVLLTPACSRLSSHFSKRSVTRRGTLTVSPANGTAGTAFSLTAAGFVPGEPMTFEIDAPNQPRFVGPSHIAGADGKVTSTYTAQPGARAGNYLVKAVGSRGTRAQSNLSIEAGVSSTTRR
jgi:hypothetical protein